MSKSLADSTQRTYCSAQKCFVEFCIQFSLFNRNGSVLPASELTILRFIGVLSERRQPSTIRTYLSAVRSLHIIHGFSDPLIGSCRIPMALKGAKRVNAKPGANKLPITPLILAAIKSCLDLSLFDDKTFWAACCTAFFGFLRGAEFTASKDDLLSGRFLALSDLSVDRTPVPEFVFVRLRFSKTDQFGKGCTIVLARANSAICPVSAITSYLWSRGDKEGPLFVDGEFSPLSKSKLTSKLKSSLMKCGIGGNYTLHSFRVGAASTAAALGFPEYLLNALGRWSNDAYKVYIKLPVNCLASASRSLGYYGK